MDFFFLLGVLLLAFPVIAIVALVKAIGANARLDAIERRLAAPAIRTAAPEPPRPPVAAETISPGGEPRAPPSVPPPAVPPRPASVPPVSAASPIAPPPRTAAAAPPPPAISLEERFGTQWVVWVGGIAIVIGGFFLVRYSIEQGWFGPPVRLALGALLAAALIVVGEWSRRSEQLSGLTGIPSAHIPGVLTAAGTAVAYADVYAAYALYDYIGPATAFVLLGLVALATLAAALLHGPALAGLGVVGGYVTPLIVASDRPNYWALYLYLAVVTAAAFALARARLWRWLAVTAVVFGLLWTFPGIGDLRVDWITPHDFHLVAGFALAALLIVSGLLLGPDAEPGVVDPVSSLALAAYLLGSTAVVVASGHDLAALLTFGALFIATIAIAWRTDSVVLSVPAAAVFTMLIFAHWAIEFDLTALLLPSGPTAGAVPEPSRAQYGAHLVLGAAFAAVFGGAGFLAQGRSTRPLPPMLWAASAVFAPIAILIALYYRLYGFERSIPFAGLALLLAALFALATEALTRRAPRPGLAASAAVFATGAVAALALAFTMAMEKGWLTIGLALMVPGTAWVSQQRPLPALRVLAAVLAVVVVARVGWEPRIVGVAVGTTPVFNWILYGYGIPAAAFWLGGHILRRRADDVPTGTVESAALLFTVLLAFLEIRHAMTGGNVYRDTSTLAEVALHVCVGLALTIGLERVRLRTRSEVHDVGALVIAALTLTAIVFGLGFLANPMIWPESVGGPVLNLILLGYGMPAVLAAALALIVRGQRPRAYSAAAAVVAVVLALAYLSLQVRTLYHGPVLTAGATGDAEQYTYSAVWLAFGVALLAAGIVLRSQAVRFASAAVVVLTVLKVFLVDMSDLAGIWKPLSLIGLGVVLLGIGWFYQRLLFPRRAPNSAPAPST
jgi:uncharacterized membrane protein